MEVWMFLGQFRVERLLEREQQFIPPEVTQKAEDIWAQIQRTVPDIPMPVLTIGLLAGVYLITRILK